MITDFRFTFLQNGKPHFISKRHKQVLQCVLPVELPLSRKLEKMSLHVPGISGRLIDRLLNGSATMILVTQIVFVLLEKRLEPENI